MWEAQQRGIDDATKFVMSAVSRHVSAHVSIMGRRKWAKKEEWEEVRIRLDYCVDGESRRQLSKRVRLDMMGATGHPYKIFAGSISVVGKDGNEKIESVPQLVEFQPRKY